MKIWNSSLSLLQNKSVFLPLGGFLILLFLYFAYSLLVDVLSIRTSTIKIVKLDEVISSKKSLDEIINSNYFEQLENDMSSVSLGAKGPNSSGCDDIIYSIRDLDADAKAGAIPKICRYSLSNKSRIRGYPETLTVVNGMPLNIFLAMRPDLPAEELESFSLRLASNESKEIWTEEAARNLSLEPAFCKSFWGEGCDFRQKLELPTTNLEPGGYFLKIKTSQSITEIPFAVRSNKKTSVKIVIPEWTTQAYNRAGGGNLYWLYDASNKLQRTTPSPRLLRVSLNRHVEGASKYHSLGQLITAAQTFRATFPDAEFISDTDLHNTPNLIDFADVIVFIGHNEYWSFQTNKNMDLFLSNGGKIANFSGNTNYWIGNYANGEFAISKGDIEPNKMLPGIESTGSARVKLETKNLAILGTAFEYGGYDMQIGKRRFKGEWVNKPADQAITLSCDHKIHTLTGRKKNDLIGVDPPLIYREIDGLPLSDDDKSPLTVPGFLPGAKLRSLGSAMVVPSYFYEPLGKPTRVSTFVEYVRPDGGTVISIPTMGSVRSLLSEDKEAQSLFYDVVKYLLAGHIDPKSYEDCPWTIVK